MKSGELGNAIAPVSDRESTLASFERVASIDEAIRKSARDVELATPFIGVEPQVFIRQLRTALPLALSDQLALAGALAISSSILPRLMQTEAIVSSVGHAYLACGLLVTFAVGQLYPGVGLTSRAEFRRSAALTACLFSIFLLAGQAFGATPQTTLRWGCAGLISVMLIPLCRRRTRKLCSHFRWWSQPVLLFSLGPGYELQALRDRLHANPHWGLVAGGNRGRPDSSCTDNVGRSAGKSCSGFGPGGRASRPRPQRLSCHRRLWRLLVDRTESSAAVHDGLVSKRAVDFENRQTRTPARSAASAVVWRLFGHRGSQPNSCRR